MQRVVAQNGPEYEKMKVESSKIKMIDFYNEFVKNFVPSIPLTDFCTFRLRYLSLIPMVNFIILFFRNSPNFSLKENQATCSWIFFTFALF